jgi:Ca2+-binding EF-hand superfamily protein
MSGAPPGHYGVNYAPPAQQQQQPQRPPPPQQAGALGFALPAPVSPAGRGVAGGAAAAAEDELRRSFDAVDVRKTGHITAADLQAALSSDGFTFRAGVAERLLKLFDRDGDGTISFGEYRAAHAFIKSMSNGFRARDTDGSGVLEPDEVRAALAASGYQMSEAAFGLLMRKFDNARCGGLRIDDYVELSVVLGMATKVWRFYDRNESHLVTFDYATFLTALISCVM